MRPLYLLLSALATMVIFVVFDVRLAAAGFAMGAGLYDHYASHPPVATLASFVGRFSFWMMLILAPLYSLNQTASVPDAMNLVIILASSAWFIYIHPYPHKLFARLGM